MGNWAWIQPDKKIWKVESDYKNGTIIVYNEAGELVFEKKGLKEAVVRFIEQNFLDLVATNLEKDVCDGTKDDPCSPSSDGRGCKNDIDADNPMYA